MASTSARRRINMKTLTAQLAREYPADNQGRTVTLLPLSRLGNPTEFARRFGAGGRA